ncbi:MAG: hypothetical protein IKU37_10705 [Candidatus Gastranaerophilales bacterium]|nr:hypothetical protein [Candidatus Gastranaerophilales bacterium]
MRYTLANGKNINIPDEEIKKSMKALDLTKEDAIQMWLEDNDYEVNEEQAELDAKAKKVKIDHGASAMDKTKSKEKKPRPKVASDEKQTLFSQIFDNLYEFYGENAKIEKENKLILVKIGEKEFKVDLIEKRPPKTK